VLPQYAIPNDWQSQDGYLTVLFCVPNSNAWRRTITGHISALANGRTWKRETGIITDAQERGKEIFESMAICDLQTDLDRIAVALESLDNKTPELMALDDFIDGLKLVPGVKWTEIEALLNILGALPGIDIKFNPMKFVTDWIFKSQLLTYQLTQANAQVAMAGSLSKGAIAEGIFDGIDLATDGGSLLLEGILSVVQTIPALQSLIDLFVQHDTAEGGTDIRTSERLAVQEIASLTVGLNAIQSRLGAINQTMAECMCNNIGGVCGCGLGGNVPITPPTYGQSVCDPPSGFDGWEEFLDYKCKAANFLTQKLYLAASILQNWGNSLAQFERQVVETGTFSIMELNAKVGQLLTLTLHGLLSANMTPAESGNLTTIATQWASDWLGAVALAADELGVEAARNDYWADPMQELLAALALGGAQATDDLYNQAVDNEDALSILQDWIATAMLSVTVPTGAIADFWATVATKAQGTLLFAFSNAVDQIVPIAPCTGNGGCTCGIIDVYGILFGGYVGSEPVGGIQTIEKRNEDASTNPCLRTIVELSHKTGATDITIVVYDELSQETYNGPLSGIALPVTYYRLVATSPTAYFELNWLY